VRVDGERDPVRRAFLLVLATGILWGTIGVASKLVYQTTTLDAIPLNLLRAIVAAAASAVLLWPTRAGGGMRATKADLLLMALLGVVLIFGQWFYLAAIDRIGITSATLIALCVPPALVAAVSVVFLGERMTGRLALALAGALLGTAMLVVGPQRIDAPEGAKPVGVAFALACAVGVAIHALGSRRLAGRQFSALLPLTVGFTAGVVAFAPVAVARGFSLHQPAIGWVLVLYLGIVPSTVAYLMFQKGLRHLPASTATIITLVEPLTAAVLAWIVFGERLSVVGIAGGVLLLASIVLLSRRAPDAVAATEADAGLVG